VDHVPGRLLLDLGPGALLRWPAWKGSADDFAGQAPGALLESLESLPDARLEPLLPPVLRTREEFHGLSGLHELRFDPGIAAPALMEELNGRADSWRAELQPRYRCSAEVPEDPGFRAQWHLKRIGAVASWAVTRGDGEISVAIIDTGVDYTHPDLAERIWVNPGEDLDGDGQYTEADLNGLDDDSNGYIDDLIGWDFVDLDEEDLWPGEDGYPPDNDPADFDGHGTHCAGDAAATGFNGEGVAAPGSRVRIIPIRAGYMANDGMGYVSHALQGLLLCAVYEADVISMSFGGTYYNQSMQNAANQLHAQGAVLVGAAGNENSTQITYPAGYAHVIAVAATDRDDDRASFSNFGDWVSIAAPGVDILSTTNGGGYGNMGGTSMATPLCAGLCAQLKTLRPEWDGDQVLDRLVETAAPLDDWGMGGGRIDAAAAVDVVARLTAIEVDNAPGRLLPGETGTLRCLVENRSGEPLADAQLLLEPLSAELDIWPGQAEVGFLPVGDSAWVEVSALWSGEEPERLPLNACLTDFDTLWCSETSLPCGVADLLIIDEDFSDNWAVLPYYVEALESLGQPAEVEYAQWREGGDWSLERFSRVLCFTGSDLEPEFAPELLEAFEGLLDLGGRLVLSGQQLPSALPEDFLAERAGAQTTGEPGPGALVWGVEDDPQSDGLRLLIVGSGGAGNQEQTEVLTPTTGEAFFTWIQDDPQQAAAVRSPGGGLLLLGFGLEGINDEPEWAASLPEVLAALLDIEQPVRDLPEVAADPGLVEAWPNPFNPVLNIRLGEGAVRALEVYDLLGRRVAVLDHRPGGIRWHPGALPSGPYYIKARGRDRVAVKRVLYLK